MGFVNWVDNTEECWKHSGEKIKIMKNINFRSKILALRSSRELLQDSFKKNLNGYSENKPGGNFSRINDFGIKIGLKYCIGVKFQGTSPD